VKPFLLLAYWSEHGREGDPASPRAAPYLIEPYAATLRTSPPGPALLAPEPCGGRVTPQCPVACWYKPGHGRLTASQALAVSCNQYFYQLSRQTDPAAFTRILTVLGVRGGSARVQAASTTPETMIGLDDRLRLSPLQVLNAYGVLLSGHASAEAKSASFPALARVVLLAGLALGADEGTSALAQQALPPNHLLLGKTGTSPALAGGRYSIAKTDGWFLGFYPRSEPVLAVMVYYPNGLGAKDAAPLGGRAIKLYLETIRQTDGP